jgi:hypothetical protein
MSPSTDYLTTILAFVGIIFPAIITYLIARLNFKADGIVSVSHDIHTLVNSNMGAQLKITMLLADRVASLTNDPADLLAAKEAHGLYDDHQKKQSIVDDSKK